MCVVVAADFTDLLGQMLQQVLSQAQVGQVGEVADAAGQRGQLIVGEHQFLQRERRGHARFSVMHSKRRGDYVPLRRTASPQLESPVSKMA